VVASISMGVGAHNLKKARKMYQQKEKIMT